MPKISAAEFRLDAGALKQDFGDSPVGRAGNRVVQQARPGAQRAAAGAPTGLAAQVRNLASRLMNAITPGGVRAQAKARAGLQDTSRQIGDLLGALSKTPDHPVDGLQARELITGLRTVMQPLTSRGAQAGNVFATRVGVHLAKMSLEQLRALKEGLKMAQSIMACEEVEIIASKTRAEIDKRLEGMLTNMLSELHSEKHTRANFEQLLEAVATLLRGQDPSSTTHELLKDFLGACLSKGTLTPEQARTLLSRLTTADLSALQASGAGNAPGGLDITEIVEQCSLERADSIKAAEAFVVAFAQASKKDASAQLLASLTDDTLAEFDRRLGELSARDCHRAIAAEVARRREQLQGSYDACVKAVADCMRKGDLPGMLVAIEAAQANASDAMMRTQRMTGKLIAQTDDVMKFRAELMKNALKELSTQDLTAVYAAAVGTKVRQLVGAMSELSWPLADAQYSQLGGKIGNVTIDIELIRTSAEDLLIERNVPVPQGDTAEWRLENVAGAAAHVREPLRQVYGIEITADLQCVVKRGIASDDLQDGVREEIASIAAAQGEERVLPGGARIDNALWTNIGRADMSVRGEDGKNEPLLNRRNGGPLTDAVREGVVGKLRQYLDDDRLLTSVSRFLNNDMFAGIEKVMASEASPIRLPDGSPGRLVGSSRASHEVARDGKGGIVLRCNYSIEGCMHFLKVPEGELVPLQPGASQARFSFEVSIDADGKASLSAPVTFSYDAKPETRPWTRPYQRPLNLEALLATSEPEARQDLRAYLANEFSVENLDFIEAVEAFTRNPDLTLDAALALFHLYVRSGAVNQVNLPDHVVNNLQKKLSAPDADKLTPAQLASLFGPAAVEIKALVERDSFPRFINHTLDEGN